MTPNYDINEPIVYNRFQFHPEIIHHLLKGLNPKNNP